MTLDEYHEKVLIPAVLRMFRVADTPSARAALANYAAEMVRRKIKEVGDEHS